MRELIFCCRHCLEIDTTGVVIDSEATVVAIRQYPIVAQCRRCHQFNCVPVSNTMISSLFEATGGFRSVGYDHVA